jgi:resuscitation-promoting factor RpfA
MMRTTDMLCARAGAAAIAAALALSPTYAAAPKPIIDLSKSPAVSGVKAAAPAKAAATSGLGALDERTLELGGGAVAILALGGAAFALSRSRRRRREQREAAEDKAVDARDPLFDEPMFQHEQPAADASALASDQAPPCDEPSDDGSDRCPGETWVERAYRGPSPANPSASLKHRLSRAAFFDKRERDVASGSAAPIEPDAGLPDAMLEEQERELA